MVVFIAGGTHTGKTLLAQRLLEKYGFPYLSIDHLKMGLIRSGHTDLTPLSSDEALTGYLWPIVREMAKTAIENRQDLVIEGCYIPFTWRDDFDAWYLPHIQYRCLLFSEDYIRQYYRQILSHASDIEWRQSDSCDQQALLAENRSNLAACKRYGCDYIRIDGDYQVDLEL
ncbi:adenylate kinase [Neobittarella massiliensis]|uniref:adenylate kinase n=1 Tax=Neobittarella massiliensis (ex Bilen et al. 2018) TaxID=2041842 RepID=UPI000CF65D70|nr:adenylate kinase [Neobittarella massiliensis]